MSAVGKAQGRYVALLLSFTTVLWGWNLMQPQGLVVQLWGVTIQPSGLWTIAPAFLTIVSLALIGTMNAMGPVWKRLCDKAEQLRVKVFWSDLDTNRNIIDYLVFLRVNPEGSAEPTEPPSDPTRKFDPYVFSYPLVLAFATITTACADYPGASKGLRIYIYGCASIQALYSFRIWYRAICRFFGVRRSQTEV